MLHPKWVVMNDDNVALCRCDTYEQAEAEANRLHDELLITASSCDNVVSTEI